MAQYGDFGTLVHLLVIFIIRFHYKKLLIIIAIFKHERSLGHV